MARGPSFLSLILLRSAPVFIEMITDVKCWKVPSTVFKIYEMNRVCLAVEYDICDDQVVVTKASWIFLTVNSGVLSFFMCSKLAKF